MSVVKIRSWLFLGGALLITLGMGRGYGVAVGLVTGGVLAIVLGLGLLREG